MSVKARVIEQGLEGKILECQGKIEGSSHLAKLPAFMRTGEYPRFLAELRLNPMHVLPEIKATRTHFRTYLSKDYVGVIPDAIFYDESDGRGSAGLSYDNELSNAVRDNCQAAKKQDLNYGVYVSTASHHRGANKRIICFNTPGTLESFKLFDIFTGDDGGTTYHVIQQSHLQPDVDGLLVRSLTLDNFVVVQYNGDIKKRIGSFTRTGELRFIDHSRDEGFDNDYSQPIMRYLIDKAK